MAMQLFLECPTSYFYVLFAIVVPNGSKSSKKTTGCGQLPTGLPCAVVCLCSLVTVTWPDLYWYCSRSGYPDATTQWHLAHWRKSDQSGQAMAIALCIGTIDKPWNGAIRRDAHQIAATGKKAAPVFDTFAGCRLRSNQNYLHTEQSCHIYR